METGKRKRESLSIEQKLKIVEALENGQTRKELSCKFNCNVSTISKILKKKDIIKKIAVDSGNIQRKRLRTGKNKIIMFLFLLFCIGVGAYEEIDNAMIVWFREMRTKNAVVSGPMIKEQAKKFAQLLNMPDFEPSNGWISRWKARNNINFQKIQGERADADNFSANQWLNNVLPDFLKNHSPGNVYNADESGLFYRALPSGTMAFKGENPTGGKMQKDRLTLLFLCNMDGSDKQIFAIGRAKQPHSFRGKHIPVRYFSNTKSWMTSVIWTEILTDLDKTLRKENRNIVLFVDNAACHKLKDGVNLTNIALHFLPANTTSLIQPLDQGIIRCFKVYYRQNIVRRQLLALERGETLREFSKSVSVLEALKIVKRSWWLVTPTTIKNCFKKAGFHTSTLHCETDEVIVQLPLPAEDFEQYVDCDTNVECYGELSTEEILEQVQKPCSHSVEVDEGLGNDDEEFLSTNDRQPSRNEAIAAIFTLRAYFEGKNEDIKLIEEVEEQLVNSTSVNFIQKKISDYYNKLD